MTELELAKELNDWWDKYRKLANAYDASDVHSRLRDIHQILVRSAGQRMYRNTYGDSINVPPPSKGD